MLILIFVVLALSIINLLRVGVMLIGSDVYDINKYRSAQRKQGQVVNGRFYRPLVTVLVPAHNEQQTLRRNLESVAKSTYRNIEVIIINDSSVDRTYGIARYFQRKYKARFKKIKVLTITARGKAKALNAASPYINGRYTLCLDADSMIDAQAIDVAVKQFAMDRQLVALAPNIKIIPEKGFLNIFQQIEYLVGHQAKKTESLFGVLYVVGGVGSMFRTSILRRVGGYDTDTLTEDMDLSLKIIEKYGAQYRIGYCPQLVTHTESVNSLGSLLRQRYRWRYGVYQVFIKHSRLFFSNEHQQRRLLTWFYLPYAIMTHVMSLMEPLFLGCLVGSIVTYGDPTVLSFSFGIFCFCAMMHITSATKGYVWQRRAALLCITPVAYVGLYVMLVVEYVATIRVLKNLYKIYHDQQIGVGLAAWKHVERRGEAYSVAP